MFLPVVLGILLVIWPATSNGCPVASLSCPNPNITFYLYNRSAPDSPYILTEANAASAPIPVNAKVVVLIHGFTGNKDFSPNSQLRPTFLKLNYYVISVDYAPLVTAVCYLVSPLNVNSVGFCTSRVLLKLIDSGRVSLSNLHIIGFSLGAQVAGATGKYSKQSGSLLPWITGLDPAGPLFYNITSTPEFRLDAADGAFVDVVHTNAGLLGKLETSGHVDFYMNDGLFQPGCNFDISCDHSRSVVYYNESLTTTVGFWGRPCKLAPSGGSFNGVCSSTGNTSQLIMGIQVPKTARGTWRVDTNASPPFARGKT